MMEPGHSLLVALMFITVLSIGIGNALLGLSTHVVRRGEIPFGWIPLSWLVLLLLRQLDVFWYTLEILAVEEWVFAAFLYMLAGPILLLFATSLMVPDPGRTGGEDPLDQYFRVARAFFLIMVVLALWMVGVDVLFGGGFSPTDGWHLAEAALFAVLAVSPRRRLHVTGTAAAWALFLSMLILRGLGVVS